SLVLDGALGRAFAGRGVTFDRDTGRFHLPLRRRGAVRLRGDGRAATWAAHGFERLGFEVLAASADADAAPLVTVGDGHFTLHDGGSARRFDALDPLFDAVAERGSAR
ncbi:MAG: hypothetical protein AAFX50_09270, partial [Acidobacteriota bacterium]